MPTANAFRLQIHTLFQPATAQGYEALEIEARTLHRLVGGYPNRGDHRMPMCCRVMQSEMRVGDIVVNAPSKGQGPSLTVKYALPRP